MTHSSTDTSPAETAGPKPEAVGPYLTEQVEFRDLDREAFYRRLHRNGPRAYEEFKRAEEIWLTGPERTRGPR